jgi:two-component system, sensor histidine kinase LadS
MAALNLPALSKRRRAVMATRTVVLTKLLSQLVSLVFLCLCGSLSNADANYIGSVAVLEDRHQDLSIADVVEAQFAPADDSFSGGYTDSAFWFRVTLRPRDDQGPLFLAVRPTFLDEVTLYRRDGDGEDWIASATGDRTAAASRPTQGATLGFIIDNVEVETVYLRLRTTSASLITLSAMPPNAVWAFEHRLWLLHFGAFAFVSGVLVWSASEYFATRDRVIGWFTFSQALQLAYYLAISGYLALIFPFPADWITSFLVIVTPLAAFVFHRVFVASYSPAPWSLRAFDMLAAGGAVVLAIFLLGWQRIALQLNAIVILIAAFVFIVVARTLGKDGHTNKRELQTTYTLIGLALLWSMVPYLGFVVTPGWSLHTTLVPGFVAALLMFSLLRRRSNLQRRVAHEAELARNLLALERERSEAQASFLAMLSHELKNPLMGIRLALGSAGVAGKSRLIIDKALESINAIIDRCTHADRVERGDISVSFSGCRIETIVDELLRQSREPERLRARHGNAPLFASDPVLLSIAVGNLVDNALLYGSNTKPVTIETSAARFGNQNGIRLIIENEIGRAGLPNSDQVFEKYYRGDGARRTSGSGLGLYIAKGIVERLGGRISYHQDGELVRFEVRFPC